MTNLEKFQILERKFGGPVKASRIAGVRYPTWYRWRQKSEKLNERTERTLDLMLAYPLERPHTFSVDTSYLAGGVNPVRPGSSYRARILVGPSEDRGVHRTDITCLNVLCVKYGLPAIEQDHGYVTIASERMIMSRSGSP